MIAAIQIASFLREKYNIEVVTQKKLPGDVDYNVYCKAKDQQEYIFKIVSQDFGFENIKLQQAILRHLEKKELTVKTAFAISDKAGNDVGEFLDENGVMHYARLLDWVPGRLLAEVNPHNPSLIKDLGKKLASITIALQDFDHPGAHRNFKWNPSEAMWIKANESYFEDEEQKDLLHYFIDLFEKVAFPKLKGLRKSVTYMDANDYNVLVSDDKYNPSINGFIDFGDALYTETINEVAVCLSYVCMNKPDCLSAACDLIKAYHESFPFTEEELQALYYLIVARLLISVSFSAKKKQMEPDNAYFVISEKPAWDLLFKLKNINPRFAEAKFRIACGLEANTIIASIKSYISNNPPASIMQGDLTNEAVTLFDWSVGSLELGNVDTFKDVEASTDYVFARMRKENAIAGVGRYNEPRPVYTGDNYGLPGNDAVLNRSIHLGIDLFLEAGEALYAPYAGKVKVITNDIGDKEYGPLLILQHETDQGIPFYTLYGHLSNPTLVRWKVGEEFEQGALIAHIGDFPDNGNWVPHVHFQIISDLFDYTDDYPGVAAPEQRSLWLSLCPDPNLILGIQHPNLKYVDTSISEILVERAKHMPGNLSVSYHEKPLKVVRGYMQYLYDAEGRNYLDLANNVAHVGHQHPRVVKAAQQQMAVLNTNTRYLHDNIVSFTKAIIDTMPDSLSVVFCVNSGSEANELAMRLATTYTQQKDMLVLEVGYHGNSQACVNVSSYKFESNGGEGRKDHIHVVPIPDKLKGKYRGEHTGPMYAEELQTLIDDLAKHGKKPAAFMSESILSCGGQVVLPDGFLKEAYAKARAAGALCIADEVQTGVGRVGKHFWSFELYDVVPDIVTIGKPIGNGHPLGVVVTTRAIADAFHNGMEWFNTFGGNPISTAIGLEVLNIVKDEKLQKNAMEVGAYLKNGLKELAKKYPIVADVRGEGLFLGFELIRNLETMEPADKETSHLAMRLREHRILVGTDGKHHNVIKMKPPMCFTRENADHLFRVIDKVLGEDVFEKV